MNWQSKLYGFAALWTLAGCGFIALTKGVGQSLFVVLGAMILLSGFILSERLIGVLTGVRRANIPAIVLLFFAKLGWWAGIFVLSKHIIRSLIPSLATGFVAFFLALISVGISVWGIPKVSPPNN